MCELYSRWAVKESFTGKHGDSLSYNDPRFEEEVGETLDKFDICKHHSISRLGNGNFYCYRCQTELKLEMAK